MYIYIYVYNVYIYIYILHLKLFFLNLRKKQTKGSMKTIKIQLSAGCLLLILIWNELNLPEKNKQRKEKKSNFLLLMAVERYTNLSGNFLAYFLPEIFSFSLHTDIKIAEKMVILLNKTCLLFFARFLASFSIFFLENLVNFKRSSSIILSQISNQRIEYFGNILYL